MRFNLFDWSLFDNYYMAYFHTTSHVSTKNSYYFTEHTNNMYIVIRVVLCFLILLNPEQTTILANKNILRLFIFHFAFTIQLQFKCRNVGAH